MNVPVEAAGVSASSTGSRPPGLYVDVRADTDVLVFTSNCPQINNPCNGCKPTPREVQIWR